MDIRLETSKGRGIDNIQGGDISELTLKWEREILKTFANVKARTKPSPIYNCHGLTFASRRTRIEKSSDLQIILKDDEYIEIHSFDKLMPGDVVIYYSESGDPNHSGLVVEIDDKLNLPIICSKWGTAGEFIHTLNDCPKHYGPQTKFFRCLL